MVFQTRSLYPGAVLMSVLVQMGPAGGIGGGPYDDGDRVLRGGEDAGLIIRQLFVWASDRVYAIQPVFLDPATGSLITGAKHGGSGGAQFFYDFGPTNEIFI